MQSRPLRLAQTADERCAHLWGCWGRWHGGIARADRRRKDGLCWLCAEKGGPF